jgi:RNA polymerase sigma-70 factor (ECF subfamily)
MCLFYLNNEAEAEDVVQEIFLKVLKAQNTFKGESSEYTWIYRIAYNTIINYLKKKNLVKFIPFINGTIDRHLEIGLESNDPAFKFEIEERKRMDLLKLEKLLEKLSNREKTAFYLFHYEHLTQAKIAEIMTTSISAVESLIHKSKKKLKKLARF